MQQSPTLHHPSVKLSCLSTNFTSVSLLLSVLCVNWPSRDSSVLPLISVLLKCELFTYKQKLYRRYSLAKYYSGKLHRIFAPLYIFIFFSLFDNYNDCQLYSANKCLIKIEKRRKISPNKRTGPRIEQMENGYIFLFCLFCPQLA